MLAKLLTPILIVSMSLTCFMLYDFRMKFENLHPYDIQNYIFANETKSAVITTVFRFSCSTIWSCDFTIWYSPETYHYCKDVQL